MSTVQKLYRRCATHIDRTGNCVCKNAFKAVYMYYNNKRKCIILITQNLVAPILPPPLLCTVQNSRQMHIIRAPPPKKNKGADPRLTVVQEQGLGPAPSFRRKPGGKTKTRARRRCVHCSKYEQACDLLRVVFPLGYANIVLIGEGQQMSQSTRLQVVTI